MGNEYFSTCLQITSRQEEADEREELVEERHALVRVVDRVMFVISLVVLLFLSFWMMLRGSLHQSHGADTEQEATSDDHH